MMKKINYIFVTIFILLLLIPAVTIPFTYSEVSTENRKLAELPALVNEEGKLNADFTSQLEQFITDHIGLRNQMVKANTALYTGIFGVSPESSVVLGSDGWIYYANTVNDYINNPTITNRNAVNIGNTYRMVQDYLESQNVSFVITIAPNKNTLYSEHMPDNYIKSGTDGNIELLEKAFAASEVCYADLKNAFQSKDEILYQRYDSHWNYKGARLGYNTILERAGYKHNSFENITFNEVKDWDGDLAGMLYSDGADKDVQLYPDIDFTYQITSHETAVDALNLSFHNDAGSGNVVLYRDSFGNAMQVWFGENFEEAYLTRTYPYDITLLEKKGADLAVIEIVERNIINLAKKAPVMPAPLCDSESLKDANELFGEQYHIEAEEKGEYLHLFGYIDASMLDDGYEVYFKLSDGSTYQAFPIYEQELLESDELSDNGFSLYIPKEYLHLDGTTFHIYVK